MIFQRFMEKCVSYLIKEAIILYLLALITNNNTVGIYYYIILIKYEATVVLGFKSDQHIS